MGLVGHVADLQIIANDIIGIGLLIHSPQYTLLNSLTNPYPNQRTFGLSSSHIPNAECEQPP